MEIGLSMHFTWELGCALCCELFVKEKMLLADRSSTINKKQHGRV
jgi:hypothetical protein